MNLLLQHNQKQSLFARQKFTLWAKFELTQAEWELIKKYQPQGAVLSPGDPKQAVSKWRRAVVFGAISAVIIGLVNMHYLGGVLLTYISMLVAWPVFTFVIYNLIRETILVGDVLTGRFFISRDVMALLDKEHTIREYAYGFRRFLDQMKTWGNVDATQVIPIEVDQAPPVRALEDGHDR
jgi:hypothetical protein